MGGHPEADSLEHRGARAGAASEGPGSVGGVKSPEPLTADEVPCEVWGVLNVTPDSFSDGGLFVTPDLALTQATRMVSEGAALIDVGGESSRPRGATYGEGAARVSTAEELERVVPVIERITSELGVPVSVDTVKAEVARAALAAGATFVNDVSGGASDALLAVVAEAGAGLVLMHTRGDGRVDPAYTAYSDVVREVAGELEQAVARAIAFGVAPDRLWIDPGIGFAKTAAQSAILLGNLDALVSTGFPVLVGASRKSFIARLAPGAPPPEARLGGSLAAVTAAAMSGCAAVRVHDVAASVQAAAIGEAMRRGRALR